MLQAILSSRSGLNAATRFLALVGFASLVAICCVTMYDGLARYLGFPRVPGFRDFGEVIFAVLIACCFPIGLLRNQNIAITFLGTALGPRATRLLNILAAVLTLIGFAIVAYALMERSAGLGDRTTRTGYMPVAPWAWAATVVIFCAVIVQIWVVMARFAELATGRDIVEDHAGLTESGMEDDPPHGDPPGGRGGGGGGSRPDRTDRPPSGVRGGSA
jgi:TRAP-type C4-dicarboxylate transport system permease small subunit